MSKETSTKELAEIIVKAIQDEPYFTKEVLVPKIRALVVGFRLRLSSVNYEKAMTEKDTARMIRANELHNLEKEFWKQQLKDKVGSENMKEFYDKLDCAREKWGKN